jgi:hypothetical protein
MNDDDTLLASAYLDGDVSADERALVETDPELLAEVARLRQVRAVLADQEPPSISRREEQLAAALDAWDRLPEAERTGAVRDITPTALKRGASPASAAAAATITTPTSMEHRRRARTNRRLLGAAAAIVLVLGAGVTLQTLSSSSDDEATSSADATLPLEEAAEAVSESGGAPAESDRSSAEIASADALAVPESGAELDTGIDDAAPPTERTLDLLETPDDLALFASDAVGAPVSPDVPAATSAPIDDRLTPEQAELLARELPLCLGADFVVGPAFYRDTEVVVGVDVSRDLALAYVGETCREVARARLP